MFIFKCSYSSFELVYFALCRLYSFFSVSYYRAKCLILICCSICICKECFKVRSVGCIDYIFTAANFAVSCLYYFCNYISCQLFIFLRKYISIRSLYYFASFYSCIQLFSYPVFLVIISILIYEYI